MNCTIKKILTLSIFTLTLISLILPFASQEVMSSESIEETADMTFPSDYLITGEMNEYSNKSIVVNNSRYRLCKNLKVFSPRNHLIPFDDIDAAEEVKLFENKRCVRKIKVLRFAQ